MSDIGELRRRARAMLPRDVYDYYAGGSGREVTLRANARAWRNQCWLAPRVLRDVSAVSTALALPGLTTGELRTPVAVAPTGFHSLAHPDGELASALGAARAGALYVLSTRSSRRIEDVAGVIAGAGGQWWFQVYLMRDRELTAGLVRRAAEAGARALVLTADTPVIGRKRRNRGDGIVPAADFLANLGQLPDPAAAEQSAAVTFADIGWLAGLSGVPVIVKGVLRADDAKACLAAGAAGVIVSNHGGRQLDRAVPTARALPAVAAALGGARPVSPADGPRRAGAGPAAAGAGPAPAVEVPPAVLVDGGLRTGEDVLAALALGARAVLLGRPVLWALATGGAAGVQDLIARLTGDLAHAMALAGMTSLADLCRDGGACLWPERGPGLAGSAGSHSLER